MKNEKKITCTICRINECSRGSDIWCPDCYGDFAIKYQVFGGEATKLYKEMNKQIIPIPRISKTQHKVNDENITTNITKEGTNT